MQAETDNIAKCRTLIEQKLGWGSGNTWQSGEFEKLSDTVFEETGVMLSSSTLKRIWGRVRYDSTPNRATLNALAQFAGYKDWREFVAKVNEPAATKPTCATSRKDDASSGLKETETPAAKARIAYKIIVPGLLLLTLVVFGVLALTRKQKKALHLTNVVFRSKPVTLGVPNTVVFEYDATTSNADSVFIQQSWDKQKRYKVDKALHQYTSTYYYPGYYSAKLILNDSVVKEHDVYIESSGWVGIIEKQPEPVYVPDSVLQHGLGITTKTLLDLGIDYKREVPVFTLSRVDKSINLQSDNLLLQTTVQNTYNEPNAVCRHAGILIMGTGGVIGIPLCKVGCVGEVGVMLGKRFISGKTTDLSGFGVDFSAPAKVVCEIQSGQVRISVNDRLAYAGDFTESIGKVVGVEIKFAGTGTVNGLLMKANK